MSNLFISYSRHDAEAAQRLVQALESRGHTVWAERDLQPGIEWVQQVETAIQNADAVITLLSPAAVASRFVQQEITLAENARRPIIPVILAQTPMPPTLAKWQAVDAAGDWDSFLENLMQAVDASTASLPMRRKQARRAPAPEMPVPAAKKRASRRWLVLLLLLILVLMVGLMIIMFTSFTGLAPTSTAGDLTRTQNAVDATSASVALAITATAAAEEGEQPTVSSGLVTAAAMTATAAEVSATDISQQAALATQVALWVEGTVVAFSATEANILSPAEAAQLGAMTGGASLAVYLSGIMAALALGLAVVGLVIWRSGVRPLPRRTAHPSGHHSGSGTANGTAPPEPMLEDFQVFISSSDKDKDWVRVMVEDLQALGYAVWWYAKDAPGLPFGSEIRSAIYHTKVFLIVVSPDSMQSKHVEEEIRWAEIYNRPIIPVVARPTSIEERLYGLAKGADIDFTSDYKQGLEFLTQAIDHYLQQRLEKMQVLSVSSQPAPG